MKKVALVHYWLTGMRGGEKVLKTIAALFPGADIFTHVADNAIVKAHFPDHRVTQTFIGRLPNARRAYRHYLPLMPMALEQINLSDYSLVISSESGPAKGVIVPPGVPHICYCHSPMRYLWDMYPQYLVEQTGLTGLAMRPVFHYLRMWDQLSADRVDQFIANSSFVASRIAKYYRRPASVIHPGVDLSDFRISDMTSDYYVFVGELVSYKKAELAIRAFNRLRKPLLVIGDGPERAKLQRLAGETIQMLGRIPTQQLNRILSECKALVFPGVEDFGLVPIEAMASGRPVIALRSGGAVETVVDGLTGLFIDRPDCVDALIDGVVRFEATVGNFYSMKIREHAEQFSIGRFVDAFKGEVLKQAPQWEFPKDS